MLALHYVTFATLGKHEIDTAVGATSTTFNHLKPSATKCFTDQHLELAPAHCQNFRCASVDGRSVRRIAFPPTQYGNKGSHKESDRQDVLHDPGEQPCPLQHHNIAEQ